MAATMPVRVLLFARLREAAGRREIDLAMPPGATPRDVWAALVELHPAVGSAEPPPEVRVALDEAYCGWSVAVAAGSTVAFIPPVAGG